MSRPEPQLHHSQEYLSSQSWRISGVAGGDGEELINQRLAPTQKWSHSWRTGAKWEGRRNRECRHKIIITSISSFYQPTRPGNTVIVSYYFLLSLLLSTDHFYQHSHGILLLSSSSLSLYLPAKIQEYHFENLFKVKWGESPFI